MSEEEIGSTESHNTPVSESTESAPEVLGAPEESTEQNPLSLSAAQAEVPPAYQPNYKFKYLDGDGKTRVEKEFDELLRPHIKDVEVEKKIRELYEKAAGLDYTKASREKIRLEAETVRAENFETKKALNILSTYVQNDDMQSFFESLKIPEDKVLKYALSRIQYRELPPEKRAEYDQMRSTKQRAALLTEENQRLSNQYMEAQSQTRAQQLDGALAESNVSQIAQVFDARIGVPGAFRDEVIKRGQMHWALYKKDLPADQAVKEVLQIVGGQMPATPNVPATPGTAQAHQSQEKKPIIPNIQGKGTSPAKKLIRSVADLKKLAAASR